LSETERLSIIVAPSETCSFQGPASALCGTVDPFPARNDALAKEDSSIHRHCEKSIRPNILLVWCRDPMLGKAAPTEPYRIVRFRLADVSEGHSSGGNENSASSHEGFTRLTTAPFERTCEIVARLFLSTSVLLGLEYRLSLSRQVARALACRLELPEPDRPVKPRGRPAQAPQRMEGFHQGRSPGFQRTCRPLRSYRQVE